MRKKKIIIFNMKDFEIDRNIIKADLTIYLDFAEKSLTSRSRNRILTKFMTIEDYVYILYYLKFEKKLSYEEIGKKLSPESKNFHNNAYMKYLNLGLNYNSNYDETKEKFIIEQKSLAKVKENSFAISMNDFNLTQPQIEEYNTLFENFKKRYFEEHKVRFKTEIYKRRGYSCLEDYFKAFYYFYRVRQLSSFQIGKMLDISASMISNNLRTMGLEVDLKTAQNNAVKHNRRNYKNTLLTGRDTMTGYLIKGACFGSIVENSIRNKFATYLSKYIGTSKYEVIIGINNRTIIQPKEIDVPIIIINLLNQRIERYAIEVNGDIYHKDKDKEQIKIDLLKNKTWIYYAIWFANGVKRQKAYGTIDRQINDICIDIKNKLDII